MNVWKKVIVISATAVLAAVVLVCVCLQDMDCLDTIRLTADAQDGVMQSISLYKDEDNYYAFLPAFADAENLRVEYAAGYTLYLDDVFCAAGSTVRLSAGQSHILRMRSTFGLLPIAKTLVVMQAKNVPALSIRLTDGSLQEIHDNQERSKTGVASLVLSDRTVDYSGSFDRFHGRGNSSWTQAKKSYALLFREPVDLLGMGAGKSWVLVSNVFDESGLRNKLAYDTAKALGVRYAVDSAYIDLYIDGEYEGLYLLTERVEVAQGRVQISDLTAQTQDVNYSALSSYPQTDAMRDSLRRRYFDIPNDPPDITGGYLLQIEHHADQLAKEESFFQTPGLSFVLSSPKYATRRQIDYISDQFNKAEHALASGDLSAIDLDSFVRYYLVQELLANSDQSSVYFCKDADRIDAKIHACAIWDFDLCLGSKWLASDLNPRYLYRNGDNWFDLLYRDPRFFSRLQTLYRQSVRQNVQTLLYDKMQAYARMTEPSFRMNQCRWRRFTGNDSAADRSQTRFDSLGAHVRYITGFLQQRIDFLDSVWLHGERYHSVSFLFDGSKRFVRFYSVKDGESLNEIPDPQDPSFGGWFDADANAYEPGRAVVQDAHYSGRLQPAESAAPDRSPLHLAYRVLMRLSGENLYLGIGLSIIAAAIACFVLADAVRTIRKRRCRHGRKE
ncbi:MAG: CotH kinase family protein [Clostridia bacterium]|nr:CotH kinase family protein [Clostridia bacterium]